MANILLDAANWTDGNYGTPPNYWTGTTYDYIGNVGTGLYYYGATMQYGGTVNAGDTVAGSIHSTSADNTEFSIIVNGTTVATETLTTGQTYAFSFALSASDFVVVTLGVGDSLYSQDAVLKPTLPANIPIPAQVMLRWSDDGGHHWSDRQLSSQGSTGQTAQRVIWRRIGSTRRNTGLDRIFEVSSDDPNQVALIGASIGDG